MNEFLEILSGLLEGFGTTCLLFSLTLAFALPLGLIISFGLMSKFLPLKCFSKLFVWIIRGTPLALQILLASFIPTLFESTTILWADTLGVKVKDINFILVTFAFIINYSCYFSEIYRSGIESIARGQYEAGKVLGLKKGQIFSKVVLFQVIRRIVPPMSNEIITLVKDTALAFTLSVIDLYSTAREIANNSGLFAPILYAGVFYLIFNGILSVLFNFIEKKMSYYKE